MRITKDSKEAIHFLALVGSTVWCLAGIALSIGISNSELYDITYAENSQPYIGAVSILTVLGIMAFGFVFVSWMKGD